MSCSTRCVRTQAPSSTASTPTACASTSCCRATCTTSSPSSCGTARASARWCCPSSSTSSPGAGGRVAEVLTIGAYGWDAETFCAALVRERVGVFCDLRRRRGVRGPEYAFVNSTRLQQRLEELGIAYRHRLDLAPSTAIRQAQYAVDESMGIGKRNRSQLSAAFEAAYTAECLS